MPFAPTGCQGLMAPSPGYELEHQRIERQAWEEQKQAQAMALSIAEKEKENAALVREELAAMGGETEINSTDRETMAPLLLRLALEGQMALAAGQGKEALELIGKAAELEGQLPAEYGPAVPVQPMAELLADTYLVLGETEKAQHYYEPSLESAVGRERSLSGLSKASH